MLTTQPRGPGVCWCLSEPRATFFEWVSSVFWRCISWLDSYSKPVELHQWIFFYLIMGLMLSRRKAQDRSRTTLRSWSIIETPQWNDRIRVCPPAESYIWSCSSHRFLAVVDLNLDHISIRGWHPVMSPSMYHQPTILVIYRVFPVSIECTPVSLRPFDECCVWKAR